MAIFSELLPLVIRTAGPLVPTTRLPEPTSSTIELLPSLCNLRFSPAPKYANFSNTVVCAMEMFPLCAVIIPTLNLLPTVRSVLIETVTAFISKLFGESILGVPD